jgi:hypothetical protein
MKRRSHQTIDNSSPPNVAINHSTQPHKKLTENTSYKLDSELARQIDSQLGHLDFVAWPWPTWVTRDAAGAIKDGRQPARHACVQSNIYSIYIYIRSGIHMYVYAWRMGSKGMLELLKINTSLKRSTDFLLPLYKIWIYIYIYIYIYTLNP